ncbi:MAG: phosphotransferase [Rhodospirillum sp.]|nr:phosphotransferase [Rhodospirillum sp.]MCF8489554.1 phosphotransferase [Rhodospirillum sp.]MCF8499743.1 phosphotransferase [Rhodospirillum sp.]
MTLPRVPPRDQAARDAALTALLDGASWGGARRGMLAGDASFRRYDRLEKTDGSRAVLMDAPPPMEDTRPFLAIARHLAGLGFSVPMILAEDVEHGFLLLEDLGDDTYTRLLADGADEEALYALAVDALARLHALAREQVLSIDVPPYDDGRFRAEVTLLTRWYCPGVGLDLSDAVVEDYIRIWDDLYPVARTVPETLVLRDFHVDNLLLLPGREGVSACGLLDFQDALRGPVTYDLMSLLEDARRDIESDLIARMKARYLAHAPDLDRKAFAASWAVLAAQRHAKVLGVFARLDARDGKPHYLGHIPRLWRLMESALTHPVLGPLADWFDRHVPPTARVIPSSRSGAVHPAP